MACMHAGCQMGLQSMISQIKKYKLLCTILILDAASEYLVVKIIYNSRIRGLLLFSHEPFLIFPLPLFFLFSSFFLSLY